MVFVEFIKENGRAVWINTRAICTIEGVMTRAATCISFSGGEIDFVIVAEPLESVMKRLARIGHENEERL